jgi:hypothetical protein
VITKPVVVDDGGYQSVRIREETSSLGTIIVPVCRLITEIKYYSLCRKKWFNSKLRSVSHPSHQRNLYPEKKTCDLEFSEAIG